MKYIVLFLYSIILLICFSLMASSFIGNRSIDFLGSPSGLAFTFVFVTLFMFIVVVSQINIPLSIFLFIQTVIVCSSLFISSIYHMFYGISNVAAVFHILSSLAFSVYNVSYYILDRWGLSH